MNLTNQQAIRRAVQLAGGQTALAKLLEVKQGHVYDWVNRDSGAPFEHCPAIEAATGVKCEALRCEVEWQRDENGLPVGYTVPIASIPSKVA